MFIETILTDNKATLTIKDTNRGEIISAIAQLKSIVSKEHKLPYEVIETYQKLDLIDPPNTERPTESRITITEDSIECIGANLTDKLNLIKELENVSTTAD